ncbi:ABC transporter substrate-binding protein [Segatella maculosa]|jgi:putative periplasmic-binding protein of ABC transporter|uniref:ABC transporter substrate-binding protein n=1 Tax=Segatella maculosa TaxID=439703 RepID=UPI0024934FC1|nr:ABC transporter substrate-binding protein [Segatella maculosa]
MKKLLCVLIAILFSVLTACTNSQTRGGADGGDTVRMENARHLTIVKYKGYTIVKLVDPWKKGRTLHTYALVPKGRTRLPAGLDPSTTIIRTPIKRSVVFTTVLCGLLYDLQAADAISGVCDLNYINIPDIQKRAAMKPTEVRYVANCGNSMSADVEKIIDMKPEGLLISPFENSGGYGKLEDIHIPIIETADYMEVSALGRAEWMKFYGMLYGREREAFALFNRVKRNYLQLMKKARTAKKSLSVITERKTGGVWYVPGGQSTIGQMLKDARAHYAFADDHQAGSLSLSFETVLDRAGQSDVWLFKYNGHPATLQELAAEYAGYRQFKAFRTHNVYACDCMRRPYFEQVSFHPDRLLSDIIQIVHPDIAGFAPMQYYERLK